MNSTSTTRLFEQLPGGSRMDYRLGPVYDQTPPGADDLTLIRGIETRESVILNRLGVYFFAQIALWEHREVCAFADEVGRSGSVMAQEQWVQQAQALCRPVQVVKTSGSHDLPASLVRTMTLLGCALIVGCLVVYWMNAQANAPLRGVLSADITSLRVPTESTLVEIGVKPGQEVFSGDHLLTLEKTEHLTMISMQEQRVHDLEQQLHQAEAQAELDLAWRTRELERELSDVRTKVNLIQEVQRDIDAPVRSAERASDKTSASGSASTRTVSRSRYYPIRKTFCAPNGMIFFSGESGESCVDAIPVAPARIPVPKNPVRLASEPNGAANSVQEAASVEMRLQRLEELRALLPQQVRRAAGVESLKVQLDDAEQRLKEMKTLSRDIAVKCPAYGKVGQIRYQAGETMTAGEIMLKILHCDRRYVIINVPTRRVNEINPGTEVDLAFPGEAHYRGRVSELPMIAEATGSQSLVTVRVEPLGRLWPDVPIGSQIDVTIPAAPAHSH